jgi:hypothetical protein
MRKFISSFGGSSVKAFTNRDFVGVRIWLTPPLPDPPYRHLAPRSLTHHQATVVAAPWLRPTVRASRRRILPRLDEIIPSKCSQALVDALIEAGTLSGDEIDEIIGREVAVKELAKERARQAAWKIVEKNAAEFAAQGSKGR